MSLTEVRYAAHGWGVGRLWLDGRVLVGHEPPWPAAAQPSPVGHPLAERLARYFEGALDDFADVELDLDGATPFERALTGALRSVRYGETVAYGELAALAGRPRAQRAAGSFCARNLYSVIVPCHRVVAAGGLGSYGSLGTGYKQRLLTLEGAL